MKRRPLLPALLALLVLTLAFALGQGGRTPQQMARTDAVVETEGHGYAARDVLVEQTDATGQLQYAMQAGSVEQRSTGGPILAESLSLQYEPLDDNGQVIPGRRWTLRADTGQLPEAAGLLELSGNIEVNAQLNPTAQPLTIRTDTLSYDTRGQTVSSDSEVSFNWGRQQLQGRGLTGDIKAGTLALESGVHGRLSP